MACGPFMSPPKASISASILDSNCNILFPAAKKKKQKTGTRKDDQYEKDFIDSEDDEEGASDTSESDSD